jgi:hypothetical protein
VDRRRSCHTPGRASIIRARAGPLRSRLRGSAHSSATGSERSERG